LFCLAVHIFKLLMNGADPYRGQLIGVKDTGGAQLLGNDAIEENLCVFRAGYEPSAIFCPPVEALPGSLITLFFDAFMNGRNDPILRPDSTDWYYALEHYQKLEITQCKKNPKHQYYIALKACPYCKADKKMMDVLKGRKKWHDSIGIVASICAIILAGGIGTGVMLSLFDRLDTVVITGGETAPAVELWHDMKASPPTHPTPPPAQTPTPLPTPDQTPEPLPPEGTLLRTLYDAAIDSKDGINIIIEWVEVYDGTDDSGYTLLERTEEDPEWLMHNRWGNVFSVQPSFEFRDGALSISLPDINRDVFYLNEDGTGVFIRDGEEDAELIWRLGDPDEDSAD
jgi:glutaredoxin